MYDFNKKIDRKNTDCLKFDFAEEYGFSKDVLPLWVADMDFEVPREVIDSLVKRMQHGIFGYTDSKQSYFEAVSNWMLSRHNWHVERDWLVKTPGIVFALSMAVQAFTNENDSVLIQPPVYYPFARTVKTNNRKLVENPLVLKDGHYEIDFDDFEKKIIDEKVKMFIFCSPHNPVGRVWTKDELNRISKICLEHKVIIVSDEIHFDFVYSPNKHTVLATISKEIEQNCVICTAPSKTFNIAGLQCSNIFIPNSNLKEKFTLQIKKCAIDELNVSALTACEAAYRYGSVWLEELLTYLQSNIEYMKDFLAKNIPQAKLIVPEGTYLTWVDFRALNSDAKKLDELIRTKANLWLDDGAIFGVEGEGFQRFNVACPRSTLEEAMQRLLKIL